MIRNISVLTYTGQVIYPFSDDPQPFNLEDIAHALAMQCRFNGHTAEHYSVAQHSYHVAQYMQHKGHSPKTVIAALLHDAAEAYIGDVVAPIKRALEQYQTLERILQVKIYDWAGCYPGLEVLKQINEVDQRIAVNEINQFYVPRFLLPSISLPLMFKLESWPSWKAEKNFIEFYSRLKNGSK